MAKRKLPTRKGNSQLVANKGAIMSMGDIRNLSSAIEDSRLAVLDGEVGPPDPTNYHIGTSKNVRFASLVLPGRCGS
jgi:hypothetical protein